MGETRQTCTAHFPGPGWEFPSSAFLPASPTGSFRWVETIQPHQHTTTHASPCGPPASAEPHHGGSTWPGNRTNRTCKVIIFMEYGVSSFTKWHCVNCLWWVRFGRQASVLGSHPISHDFCFSKDAPGIGSNVLHCYDGDDPRISHPYWAAPTRVQHSAAPSMLGNVQRTALSALLPSSSCEFEKEEPNCQWHPCSTPYKTLNLLLLMNYKLAATVTVQDFYLMLEQ